MQGQECLFLETALHTQGADSHAQVHCVPVSPAVFAQAPMVFKQELAQAEPDSQHGAKGTIDTSEKGLRRSIPAHFPYVHVQFGYRKGLLHVVDDEAHVAKAALGRKVLLGLTGQEEQMHGRAKQAAGSLKTRQDAFLRAWDSFDWTRQLD